MTEDRSRTRRRPIGRDYAAAKDAEVGIWKWEGGKDRRWDGEMVRRRSEFGIGNAEVGIWK
jgi:hypothetical protein